MIKKNLLLLLVVFITASGFDLQKNTIARSAISFQVKNLGINTTGSIGGLQADIHFDPSALSSSAIEASVDANTINTGNSGRDDHLKSADFFDVTHYPKINIKSVSLKHKSGNKYTGQFNLTIKGKTKTVEVPFTCTSNGSRTAFKGSFKMNRLDFGIGESSVVLANDVTVDIDVETGS